MVSDAVNQAALATCDSFVKAVGERRVCSVTLEQVKQLLTIVELFSKDNNNLNWHVHVSGYDKNGKLFWLPIYEDEAVCTSPAAHVLSMVYRYVESGSCMESTAASIMTDVPRSTLTLPPCVRGQGSVARESGGAVRPEDAKDQPTTGGGGGGGYGGVWGRGNRSRRRLRTRRYQIYSTHC